MKTASERTVYLITVNYSKKQSPHRQYILPNELHLIKTWLNQKDQDEVNIVTVKKVKLTTEDYKRIFY
jgi:hypothetical protein